MWLLEQSLGGVSTALVFQVYELLDSYQQVYQRESNPEVGKVAIALATKLRCSKFHEIPKVLRAVETEIFAAAMRTNAFITLHDRALCASQLHDAYLDCCCELSLFNSLNWSAEQVLTAAEAWRAGQPPEPSEISTRLARKHKLSA